jgi:hypothetical protein
VYGVLLVLVSAAAPCLPADPPVLISPLKAFVRSPFSSELEVYTGGITGKSAGAAFKSVLEGDYGIRFSFGFMKALNFSLNYMYSNQTRSFTAATPPTGSLPHGTALMSAANLNMFFGNGEWSLLRLGRNTFYLTPGVGFVRTGARSLTIVTPLGNATAPILPGTAVTCNLGAGIKVFPVKHFGLRLDIRDNVSGGATGPLNPSQNLTISGTTFSNPAQFFGPIPIQNNLVFTVGLIFKLL